MRTTDSITCSPGKMRVLIPAPSLRRIPCASFARLNTHCDAAGTLIADSSCNTSHRDRCLDRRMRIVTFEREVLVTEGKQVLLRREAHARERARRAGKLLPRLLDMVEIEVHVAECKDQLARRESSD